MYERRTSSLPTAHMLVVMLLALLGLTQPAHARAASRSAPTAALHLQADLLTSSQAARAPAPAVSPGLQLRGRIYVEDTPPPALDPLSCPHLLAATDDSSPPLPLAPTLPQRSFGAANRQRAP